MRLNNYDSRMDLLIDWVREVVPLGGQILDIGASDGSFCPELNQLASGYLIDGVDPDFESMVHNSRLRCRYPGRLEDAELPQGNFDAALAVYVAEHVEDPDAFLAAAKRVLKPGGSLFMITPNGDHYFARIARFLQWTGLQERVLRLLRPDKLVDQYHHAALYRMNRPAAIERLAKKHGFDGPEFRFSERYEEFACYFPGPTKLLPRVWERFVEWTGKEHLLGNLMVRLVKKGSVGGRQSSEAGQVLVGERHEMELDR